MSIAETIGSGTHAPIKMEPSLRTDPRFNFRCVFIVELLLTQFNTRCKENIANFLNGVKTSLVPGIHSKDQTLIGCYVDKQFLSSIDQCREAGQTRSQFCRDALREKLAKMGIEVALSITVAPDRTGKGGPRRKEISTPRGKASLVGTSDVGARVERAISSAKKKG